MGIKTYSELILLPTFEERFRYLKIGGSVGQITFGHERYLNQLLYNSEEWRRSRRVAIIRDNGCDLGCEGYEIYGKIMVHHINPITVEDILERNPRVFDLENLICSSHNTHNAVHYGDESLLFTAPIERTRNDMCPWKNN